MIIRRCVYFVVLISVALICSPISMADVPINMNDSLKSFNVFESDFHSSSQEPFEIYNEHDELLSIMARVVYIGDELIAQDNKHYRVNKVSGRKAYAKYIGKHDIELSAYLHVSTSDIPVQQQGQGVNTIAIYHTHSAESYVPSDGTESIPGSGGIFDVGKVFADALEAQGFTVIHDLSAHEPRDAQAYNRSRRTAVELLKQAPSVLIDVHRDGIPDPEFYRENISGQIATQIRLVVGRQNQNMQSNLEFAKQIKAAAEEVHPGLVREIFMARGNYNQDLAPRVILIEVGTHTNTKEEAQKGAALFAEVMPAVMGVSPGQPLPPGTPGQRSDLVTVLWIVVLTAIGGGAFLLISTGSWENAFAKLKQFVTKEWANYLGGIIGKRKNDK
ncbi:MAG: stage II sporulation protein P [Bacillota bacterium]